MKIARLYLRLTGIVVLLSSCHPSPSNLDKALNLSGKNRSELEEVLTHYSLKESDSLHLKAAQFLIENMPGHHELYSSTLTAQWNFIDSLYPNMPNIAKSTIHSILLKKESSKKQSIRKEDIENISASYLIAHIDNALSMWQTSPWLKDVSFEDFCEYLLPYRIINEPLLKADSTSYLWKEIRNEVNYYHYTSPSLDDIKFFQEGLTDYKYDKYFHDLLTPQLPNNNYTFDCLDKCYYDLILFRHIGIPSAIDFIPDWATRNGRHYWRTLIDPSCLHNNLSDVLNPKTAKVYRMTYSHNAIPQSNGKDSIPEFFAEPFYRDVTEKYMKVSDLTIHVDKKELGYTPKYIYLSIFNDLEWKPVAWAENKNGKAQFPNIGLNLIYLPVYFREKEMLHTCYPLQINLQGKVQELRPNMKKRITLTLTRKYPLTYSKINWGKSLNGCCIEASNHADFSVSDTLGVLSRPSSSLNWVSIPIQATQPYRYWRLSKKGRFIELGELEFYDKEGHKINAEVIAHTDSITAQNAFDGNILTFSHSYKWLGIDCKKKTEVKEVRYTSRTDGNGIYPNRQYELSYFTKNGWQIIELKKATADSLVFESIPSNALYWLKDLTEGKEERIFTYENGEIRFW